MWHSRITKESVRVIFPLKGMQVPLCTMPKLISFIIKQKLKFVSTRRPRQSEVATDARVGKFFLTFFDKFVTL